MPVHASSAMEFAGSSSHSFNSPSATLTGTDSDIAARTSFHTETSERPSEPALGSLISMIEAPPATAACASAADRTLTNSRGWRTPLRRGSPGVPDRRSPALMLGPGFKSIGSEAENAATTEGCQVSKLTYVQSTRTASNSGRENRCAARSMTAPSPNSRPVPTRSAMIVRPKNGMAAK